MPDVDVTIDEGPLDGSAFLAAIERGASHDLLYIDRDLIGFYAARGLIRPIDDQLAATAIDVRQFRDAALRQVTFHGAMYGIPEYYDIQLLVLHLPALASVSVFPREVEFGDWVVLPEVNRSLTLVFPSGLGRAGVETGLPESLPIWAKANDVDLLSADGLTANLDHPGVIEALGIAKGMIADQGGWDAVNAFHDELDLFGAENPFARNRVGVMAVDASHLDLLAEASPHLEIAVKPVVDRRGMPIPCPKGMAWVIPTDAHDAERSFAFAWAMSRPETWVAGARARAAAARSERRRFEEPYTANKVADLQIWTTVYEPSGRRLWDAAVQVVRTYQETGFAIPPNAAPREVRAAWISGVRRALGPSGRPTAAMREANQRAQAALDAATPA